MLTFTGCQKETEIKPQSVFSADFTLSYNEMQIKGEIEAYETQKVKIKVASPESLAGMSATAENDNFEINYNGMSVSYTKDDLPEGAFFKLVLMSLDKIIDRDGLEFESTDGGYTATEETELGDMTIFLSDKFFIESIKIPNQGFNLKLTEKGV